MSWDIVYMCACVYICIWMWFCAYCTIFEQYAMEAILLWWRCYLLTETATSECYISNPALNIGLVMSNSTHTTTSLYLPKHSFSLVQRQDKETHQCCSRSICSGSASCQLWGMCLLWNGSRDLPVLNQQLKPEREWTDLQRSIIKSQKLKLQL